MSEEPVDAPTETLEIQNVVASTETVRTENPAAEARPYCRIF